MSTPNLSGRVAVRLVLLDVTVSESIARTIEACTSDGVPLVGVVADAGTAVGGPLATASGLVPVRPAAVVAAASLSGYRPVR